MIGYALTRERRTDAQKACRAVVLVRLFYSHRYRRQAWQALASGSRQVRGTRVRGMSLAALSTIACLALFWPCSHRSSSSGCSTPTANATGSAAVAEGDVPARCRTASRSWRVTIHCAALQHGSQDAGAGPGLPTAASRMGAWGQQLKLQWRPLVVVGVARGTKRGSPQRGNNEGGSVFLSESRQRREPLRAASHVVGRRCPLSLSPRRGAKQGLPLWRAVHAVTVVGCELPCCCREIYWVYWVQHRISCYWSGAGEVACC